MNRTLVNSTVVGSGAGARAFTLIEILAAMFILTLGVLGLGALFPAVIRQQRISSDAVNGILVTSAARSVLAATDWNGALLNPATKPSLKSGAEGSVFGYAREFSDPVAGGLGHPSDPSNFYRFGEWYLPPVDRTNPPVGSSPAPGTLVLGDPADANRRVFVKAVARLIPGKESGALPQFVWDIALQLDRDDPANHPVVPADPPTGRMRAAIFARRIDPGIHIPREVSLLQAFSLPVTEPNFRVPLGEDAAGDPTLDGTGGAIADPHYSRLRLAAAHFVFDRTNPALIRRDRLYFTGSTLFDRDYLALSQVNQKLVDNLGNIYTVIGAGSEDAVGRYVTVDPPVPASVLEPEADKVVPTVLDYMNKKIVQVVFSPQVPAGVVITEIKP